MKYLFFGTPDFAAVILEKLVKAGLPPSFVVCNSDKPVGRKHIITPPSTKLLAIKYNIPILQPEVLSNLKFKIQNLKFDVFIIAAYAKIIPKEILELPRLGVIGVHPSLLPKYRGSSPIQSVILNGEQETGVTLFLADEKVDHGAIVSSIKYQVSSNDNYEFLNKKLAELGAELLIETLPKFLKGEIVPLIQDETQASYTKKFIAENGYVNLQKDEPNAIERKIRALNPEPGVYTFMDIKFEKKRVKLLEAELVDGKLKLTRIQVEGGKPQNVAI